MKINQVQEVVNQATEEVLGRSDVLAKDLSNLVDVGEEIIGTDSVDKYTKSLVNHIGRVVTVDRVYEGNRPSLLMDGWEYGSILEKISMDSLPDAENNDTWELTDGKIYEQDQFNQPKVSAKFFNSKNTFQIPISFTERQIKESFSNATQLNAFITMIYNAVANAMTVKSDSMVQMVVNNAIAETIYDDIATETGSVTLKGKTGRKAINLLKLYNDKTGNSLTAENSIHDEDFIRFASYIINLYSDRLTKISSIFNVGGKERFTPKDKQTLILLSDFSSASETFLYSNTFNKDDVLLPTHETVPYFQGSGQNYDFADVSKISVKTPDNHTVEASGIVGVLMDKEAAGVANQDQRVTTHYNARAEFYNNYYKFDASYYNDLNENTVVFFVA